MLWTIVPLHSLKLRWWNYILWDGLHQLESTMKSLLVNHACPTKWKPHTIIQSLCASLYKAIYCSVSKPGMLIVLAQEVSWKLQMVWRENRYCSSLHICRMHVTCVNANILCTTEIIQKKLRRNLFPLILSSDGADSISLHLYPVGGMKPESHYGYDYHIQHISVHRHNSIKWKFYISLSPKHISRWFLFCSAPAIPQ